LFTITTQNASQKEKGEEGKGKEKEEGWYVQVLIISFHSLISWHRAQKIEICTRTF